jgi:hypothetical protein
MMQFTQNTQEYWFFNQNQALGKALAGCRSGGGLSEGTG